MEPLVSAQSPLSATVALKLSEKFHRLAIFVSILWWRIHPNTLFKFAGPRHIHLTRLIFSKTTLNTVFNLYLEIIKWIIDIE